MAVAVWKSHKKNLFFFAFFSRFLLTSWREERERSFCCYSGYVTCFLFLLFCFNASRNVKMRAEMRKCELKPENASQIWRRELKRGNVVQNEEIQPKRDLIDSNWTWGTLTDEWMDRPTDRSQLPLTDSSRLWLTPIDLHWSYLVKLPTKVLKVRQIKKFAIHHACPA